MSRFRIVHRGRPASGGSAVTYDNRFGTDTVTAASTGWFTFGLHSGNRRIWCDANKADDTGNGLTAATAKKTIDAAFTAFLSGFTSGDQLMIAGTGSRTYSATSTSSLGGLGGISATYPTAILSYDPADPTNLAKIGKLTGSDKPIIQLHVGCNIFSNYGNFTDNYFATQGLYFDGLGEDGSNLAGIAFQGVRHDGIVWQNCDFKDVNLTINQGGTYDATAVSYYQTGNISKCSFFGVWASGANISGAYIHGTNGFYLTDNVFGHCGWKIGNARDDVVGGANGVNHGHYISAMNKDVHVERNFYVDTSADGMNLRGNGFVNSCASLDEPICGYLGTFTGSLAEAPDGITILASDWLMMGGADYNAGTPGGFGFSSTNTVGGSYAKKIVAFDSPKFGVSGDIFFQPFNNGNSKNIQSITHSGTTATVTTMDNNGNPVAHGLTTGQHIYLDQASPSAYNVADVAITSTGPTTFTYTMASTPATNATVVGNYTAQVMQSLLLDEVRTFNHSRFFIAGQQFQATNAINNTYTNIISDELAPGTGNQVASSALFPNYKTRDQVITAVLNGIGITPGANYYARKSQLINAALYRPDLPWAEWLIGVGFPAMGVTPTYTTPAYSTYTDTPLTVYPTALGNLTLSTLNFTHGVAGSATLTGTCALPVLTCTDLPAGLTLTGRVISGTPTSAGTPTIHVDEAPQGDPTNTHRTAFTLSIA